MAKNLVIVESPAKCRTISRYLGKDFDVKATMGHIIDLPEKELKEKILGLAGNEISGETNVGNIVDQVADKVIERLLSEIKGIKQK